MKITRNEKGKYPELAVLHSFDLTGVDSETYGDLANALRHAIELYEIREWNKKSDSPYSADHIEIYNRFKRLSEQINDYKNHERTLNGKKIASYSQVVKSNIASAPLSKQQIRNEFSKNPDQAFAVAFNLVQKAAEYENPGEYIQLISEVADEFGIDINDCNWT
ncbi:hypothetical protein P5G61_16840 [Paenibacillus sp. F6_3S_P_1C]|uniref:Uncharacterized protein n=1 Tax=Paenibacillus vandeheii TaxID=3035917 RepID=A0ABT8JDH0_9BACL|nr:hypothetical protein [Paenibacillus vandeheii]MDN4602908.1 hypothetical protein [Paenibacillus vandeheii]